MHGTFIVLYRVHDHLVNIITIRYIHRHNEPYQFVLNTLNLLSISANEKSYPPSKKEVVHRLEKISLKGKRCIDLASKNITTVKHLMRHYHRDKYGLQKVNMYLQ
jgi:hypothetical protein